MNRRAIWAIARKDIRAITANMQVWLPMLILPVFLGVVLPIVLVLAFQFGMDAASEDLKPILRMLEMLPAGGLREAIDAYATLNHKVVYVAANYMLTPFFMLVPLMTASVVSADSFAGEKERGTLETLLFAPVDMLSLFVGKILASLIPAVGLSLATFAIAAIAVNAAGWPLFHGLFFPNLNWLPLMLLVIPMISLLAILFNVFISARVATFQAAYQMGGMVILPVLLLLAGQLTGVILLDSLVVTILGLVLGVINFVLLQQVLKRLDRTLLFASQVK